MVGVLLLVQWLVAAYACPASAVPASRTAQPAAVHATMADCHGMTASDIDADNPALCKAHCSADQQAPAQAAPDDAATPSLGWFFLVEPAAPALPDLRSGGQPVPRSGAPPGWPPIYLTQQVLRN